MRSLRFVAAVFILAAPVYAATFGTVVANGASYSDIALDETRSQLYLVNTALSRVEIYNTRTRAALPSITVDSGPESAALSRDGRFLFVTAYAGAVLDVIDLTQNRVATRVTLPSNPEGVAVGADGRVLISAVAVGTNTTNTLLIYDPASGAVTSVAVPPPAPTPPVLPPPNNRAFNSPRGRLLATPDGKTIVGSNGTSNTAKVVFVFEVASGTVLRSRAVANLSSTLSVAPDGSRFMAGSTLFETSTLQVLAQENAANAPFAFPTGNNGNFNLQQNQGGSVFAPDGNAIYAAFNMAPIGSATGTHTVELLINDPDNLLIRLGIQLPENMAGKMVIESTGANIYALSDSGFTALPIGNITSSPLAQPDSQIVLLTNDQCGVYAAQNSATTPVSNLGRGRFTATLQAFTAGAANNNNTPGGIFALPGLGGGGAGGGIVLPLPGGGGIVIPIPGRPGVPGVPTPGTPGIGGAFPTPGGGGTTTAAAATPNGPVATVINGANGVTIGFRYNAGAAANPGTVGPSDFTILSPEAINIPGNVHAYQNNRSSESQGTIMPIPLNASAGEGLTDIVLDSARQRVYVTNSGQNRIEVYDIAKKRFIAPIKVGQLPHGMALSSDGVTLYVANTGGESISIVNLDQAVQTGRVAFPPLPFNAAVTLSTPQAIAAAGRGPQFVMSDGTLWKINGTQAVPRQLNPSVFGATARTVGGGNPAIWSMAATPGGEYVMLMTGTGNAYLFDDAADEFTLARQVLTAPLTGYVGPVTAGPQGRYFSVGGAILNASLAPITSSAGTTSPRGRPVAAVAAVGPNAIALFSTPVRANATSTVADAGMIEIYNPLNPLLPQIAPALEGAPSVVTGNGRANAFARTMAVDAANQTAYAITASGLSIIPLAQAAAVNPATLPAVNTGGVVNLADYTSTLGTGSLLTIFGRNLAASTASATVTPLPTILGGTCVTLNNQALPLTLASPGQVNAQIPTTLAAGRWPLVVHSLTNTAASLSTTVTVAKYAPAVLVGGANNQPAVLHLDGSFVDKDHPASRDERLLIFATGLGPTTGGTVVTGRAAPTTPLAEVCKDIAACDKTLDVFFGPPTDSRSRVVVEWSGMVPGLVGVYQINVYVPGTHIKGDAVPVTLKIANVSNSSTGPVAPKIAVD